MMQTWRFQPYGTPRAFQNEYGNAEAGPSTLVPPLIPHLAPLTTPPSGGIPEATANAEYNQLTTEEDRAPVSNFYCPHIPHVAE